LEPFVLGSAIKSWCGKTTVEMLALVTGFFALNAVVTATDSFHYVDGKQALCKQAAKCRQVELN
jgi:hypothetical protein